MKIILIYDKDNETENSKKLKDFLLEYCRLSKYMIKVFDVTKYNVKSCSGCIGCWIKTPGKCVKDDLLNQINYSLVNSDIAIFISAISFGQYSATIKNVMDRYIPNVLPFYTKKGKVTIHPERYDEQPLQILIGHGKMLSNEEKDTFTSLTDGKYNKGFNKVFICGSKERNVDIENKIINILEEYD